MLEVSEDKAEGHYNIAKQIYNYVISLNGKQPYGDWTLDRALEEINAALDKDNQGLYYQLQGDIFFAQQKYPEAFASYDAVNHSTLASAASFYSAAKTKELIEGASKKEAIALMDSAVARFIMPYGKDAAPYLYERGRMKAEDGQFREAVKDYNAFSDAMMGQVSAEFYVIREQAEMQCRMYQQAINDINKAIEMEQPGNESYWVEKGSVHLRVNQPEEAVKALTRATELNPKNAAAYRMMGYAQIQQKKKKGRHGQPGKSERTGRYRGFRTYRKNINKRYHEQPHLSPFRNQAPHHSRRNGVVQRMASGICREQRGRTGTDRVYPCTLKPCRNIYASARRQPTSLSE